MKQRLCDLQVNGFRGVDFSSPDLTASDFRDAVEGLMSGGTDVFLPTIITSGEDIYRRNLGLMVQVRESHPSLEKHLPGFHLEGPFISPAPGAVGAHDPQWVQAADEALLLRLMGYAKGRIRLLTVAAEVEGIEPLIRRAKGLGIAVSCGHQLAGADDLARAVQAGATALTHLGNGMPNQVDRHRNPLLAGLGETRLKIMFIADGHHLPREVLRLLLRLNPIERLIVVSDASPAAGLPPGNYTVLGNEAVLEANGRLHNPQKNCLVGSSATLAECVRVMEELDLVTQTQLGKMVWDNPMALIGEGAA